MPRSEIKGLTVTYADGTEHTWLGRGFVDVERTPVAGGGMPTPRPDDVRYVQALINLNTGEAEGVTQGNS